MSEAGPALPEELWSNILSRLTFPSLASAAQVSRCWHLRATAPALWRAFPLTKKTTSCGGLKRALGLARLARVEAVRVVGDWRYRSFWPSSEVSKDDEGVTPSPLLLHLLSSAPTTRLTLERCDLRRLEPERLGRLVATLTSFTLAEARCTGAQVTTLARRELGYTFYLQK